MSTSPPCDFSPDQFVDRDREKRLYKEIISNRMGSKFLEISSISGQGKTELLKWMCYTIANDNECYPTYLDFETSPKIRDYSEMITQITTNLSCGSSSKSIHQCLEDKLKTHKVVLYLNATEYLSLEAFWRFEDEILKTYAERPNFFTFTVGQKPLKWNHISHDTLERYVLPPFDEDGTREHLSRMAKAGGIRLNNIDDLSRQIHHLSQGHPYTNYKLFQFITGGGHHLSENIEPQVKANLPNLIKEIIVDRILKDFDISSLGDKYPSLSEILKYIACLRRIEFGPIWFMLTTYLPDYFEDQPLTELYKLLSKFQSETRIVTPWALGSGFDLESPVRNILLANLRYNERDLFVEIQEKLAKQYDIWARQTQDATQVKNIIERLYHQSVSLKMKSSGNIDQEIKNDLYRYLESHFTPEFQGSKINAYQQLDRLKNALQNDDELAKMLDRDGMVKIVDDFRGTI